MAEAPSLRVVFGLGGVLPRRVVLNNTCLGLSTPEALHARWVCVICVLYVTTLRVEKRVSRCP